MCVFGDDRLKDVGKVMVLVEGVRGRRKFGGRSNGKLRC